MRRSIFLRTSYKYDFNGNITAKEEICGSTTKLTSCTYDTRGRLLTETTKVNNSTAATVSYAYDDLGRLAKRTFGNGVAETQNYNIQGWATTSTAKKGSSNIYSQTLSYYATTKGTTPLYSGNKITSITGTNNGTAITSATYSYDSNGNTTTDGLKNLQITYNILNLPQKVSQSGTTKATYTWFADESKYSTLDNTGNGYHYIGSLIYNTSTQGESEG